MARPVTWRKAALAGGVYACLMTAFRWSQDDPFRGSYALGWLFYAVMFGVLFWAGMKLVNRLGKSP